MKKIKIIENNDNYEKKNVFVGEVITKKANNLKKIKLKNICIYSNLIIIYIILYITQKNSTNRMNQMQSKHNNNDISNPSISEQAYDSLINKYKRSSIIWPLPDTIIFRPIMTKNEIIALSYFMKPENIYFEFGSGGSTNLASFYKVKTYSVESDVKWHEKLKFKGITANYITVDLKVNHLGYPGNNTNVDDWKKYIQSYKREYNADIILIDGRFRVACALDIFRKIRKDTLVLLHDYERKKYHVLEQFYIKLQIWDSLVLFIKDPKVSSIPEKIYNFYLKDKLL